MAAKKKKRRPTGFDMAYDAYIQAGARANAWAGKCLHYREAKKSAQAIAAERRAKYWLRKMLMIEARAVYGKLSVGLLVTKYFAPTTSGKGKSDKVREGAFGRQLQTARNGARFPTSTSQSATSCEN